MNGLKKCIQPLVFVFLLGSAAVAADSDREKVLWLFKKMDTAYSIKPGMTIEQLLEVFTYEGGGQIERVYTDNGSGKWSGIFARKYVLRDLPCIKIDVQFDEPINLDKPKPGAKIKWISKPYLEHQVLD